MAKNIVNPKNNNAKLKRLTTFRKRLKTVRIIVGLNLVIFFGL